jgi:hypothetical protein
MKPRGPDWIDDLPSELASQRALLGGLLALCENDDRIRWLVIGCSLSRGAGDRLSDLDLAMGIRDEDFDAARPDLRRAVDGLGELVDSYHHQLPSVTQAHKTRPVTPAQIREWAFKGTVADLDPARLLDAARHVAALLNEVGDRLPDNQRAVLPEAMARYITADLEQIR